MPTARQRTFRSRSATCSSGPPAQPHHGVVAHPRGPHLPQIWVLGSSDYGAQLAAHFGLPYAFAYFFTDGQGCEQALELYRTLYKPSERHPTPQPTICVWALAADSEAEATHHALSRERWRVDRMRGELGPLQRPDDIAARGFTADEQAIVEATRARRWSAPPRRWAPRCAHWPARWAWTSWWSTPGRTTRRCGAIPTRCWRGSSRWHDGP